MGKRRGQQDDVQFKCTACLHIFDAPPARIEDAPEDAWHPWRYYAPCPICSVECTQSPQSRHLFKLWASSTGPKTVEGKARSAANLDGHPTAEEAQRTRFNALKHGLNARVARFWPARPGAYPQCNNCELFINATCRVGDPCQKKTELFLRHHIAFETGDPKLLGQLRADLHANLTAIVEDLILAVIAEGAMLKTPEWYYDKDGDFHLAQYVSPDTGEMVQIFKLENNPAIKLVGELCSRFGLDLNSQGMTPKVQDDNDVIRGFLDAKQEESGALLEHQQRQTLALEGLAAMVVRSRERTMRDPVLLEYKAGEDG